MQVFINNLTDQFAPVGVSELGTIVHDNVVFPANPNEDYPEVVLNAVTIRHNRPKNIVISQISGRQGNIKEYTGVGDQEIVVTAIIAPKALSAAAIAELVAGAAVNLGGQAAQRILSPVQTAAGAVGLTPDSQNNELLIAIRRLDDFQGSVPIESKYINNILGVQFVVVEDVALEHLQNGTWQARFRLLSDDLIDLGDYGGYGGGS